MLCNLCNAAKCTILTGFYFIFRRWYWPLQADNVTAIPNNGTHTNVSLSNACRSVRTNHTFLLWRNDASFIVNFVRSLVSNYLHSFNVIHRDLKPANILLNEDCSLKVSPEMFKVMGQYSVFRCHLNVCACFLDMWFWIGSYRRKWCHVVIKI